MRKVKFTDWLGILIYIAVAIVCFCQDEILGGIGWVFAAMWLFFFNVECYFFRALMDKVREMQKEDGQKEKEYFDIAERRIENAEKEKEKSR